MDFCPKCGARLKRARDGGLPRSCRSCGAALARGDAPPPKGRDDVFPFPSMRPHQKEIMEQVNAALSASKRFIILEAPVGFGKSAIAAWLSNKLDSAYLLTSTKQLQDQYSLDFGFKVVTGRSNFTCLVPTSTGKFLPCSRGRCEADWKLTDCPHYLPLDEYDEHSRGLCSKQSRCEHLKDGKLCFYYEQKWDAFRSPVMVANYSFFLAELQHTNDIGRRRLLVCDEAHDLENQMVGWGSYTLSKSTIDSYRVDETGADSPLDVIPNMGLEAPTAWTDVLATERKALECFVDTYLSDRSMQDRVTSCKNALVSLKRFMDDLEEDPSNWIVNSVREGGNSMAGEASVEQVVFTPLEIGDYTSKLFETADTVLLMSATIFSKDAFCKSLGIVPGDACFIREKESSFPVENRRIHAVNAARLSQSTIDAAMGSIASAVDELMTRHAGEKGVIHTTSYKQASYIMDHVAEPNRSRLSTTQNVVSRSELLKSHASTEGSVLISPSLYLGVDLKDELSRFQIVVKVPYPDLSDRRIRIKSERDPGWYDWQTALRLVQTYGRSVRSENDYAVTYVLDSNFGWFVNKNRGLFPEYFTDALVNSSPG